MIFPTLEQYARAKGAATRVPRVILPYHRKMYAAITSWAAGTLPGGARNLAITIPPRHGKTLAAHEVCVTIEEGTGPDGKPFRYIRVAYTFENVTDSDAVAPYTDINAYQDGIKLDRSYKVQDQRAQKQIEPGGKLKSFTAFAPDSETVPVTVKVMAPGEKEPRSERCYCIVNPGLQ